jgi:DNA (cytosine-5)-methyltransferase 1
MKAVDLFAGCGGLSLGLAKSNIEIVGAFEKWEPAIKIYEQNFKHLVYDFDLNNTVDAIKIISKLNPDLIAGGAPCQDFSSAGKRDENLGRASLTVSLAEIIDGVSPKWFIMENVDIAAKSTAFKTARTILSKKYGITEIVLDASYCGVPQKRKRVFLIGKRGEKDGFMQHDILAGLSTKSLTVKEYLKSSLDTHYYYRHARSYSRRGIFSVEEPSPTIRGVNRPIPPNYKLHKGDAIQDISKVRPLTFKERSQIQTFPTTFKWGVSNKSTLEQILGNAVPVKLAEFVGKAVMKYETLHN